MPEVVVRDLGQIDDIGRSEGGLIGSIDLDRKVSGGAGRVAIVLSELRPGGMERVVVHLASHLPGHGVRPLVICLQRKGELAAELEEAGVEVAAIGSMRGKDPVGLGRLAWQLARFRPDVVHLHDYSSLPYVALANRFWWRCPIAFTAHGLLYDGFEGLQGRYRYFARSLSGIAAVSEEVRERHTEFLDWRGAIRVVPNGVPDIRRCEEDRAAIRRELGVGDDEFVFLAVGNARPEKAFEDLIAATRQLQDKGTGDRKVGVWIVGKLGDDEYSNGVRRLAEESDIPGLRLVGYRSDVRRFYSAADAFVISSRSEGLPMVLLEAMTAGLPVVATRVGGIPNAVPAGCGRLVEPGEPGQLAEAMHSLLEADEETVRSMSNAARDWAVDRYGVDRMVKSYVDFYGELIGQEAKRR